MIEATSSEDPILPYRALWSAVVTHALSEAKAGPAPVLDKGQDRATFIEQSIATAEAFIAYWTGWVGSLDFKRVCDYAEVEPTRAASVFIEEYTDSYKRYQNGTPMRFTKIMRKRKAHIKKAEGQ